MEALVGVLSALAALAGVGLTLLVQGRRERQRWDRETAQRALDRVYEHSRTVQLRNLQSLVELGVDKNTTVVFPAPLMSTIGELGSFLARETAASAAHTPPADPSAAAIEPPILGMPTAPSIGGGALTGGRQDTD